MKNIVCVALCGLSLAACPTDDSKGGKGASLPETYAVLVTTTSDTCFGETGSTLGGGTSAYGFTFFEEDGAWSVLIDPDLPLLPCEGSDTEYTCTVEHSPETTTVPGEHVYTLTGTRDSESLEATLNVDVVCDGTASCVECNIVHDVVGSWYEE